jgi:transcriptional regulator with XRE-family HTH domain
MEELPRYFELCVIQAWLKGKTRDEIAEEFGKSQGTVSNIISRMRNRWSKYDADAMRELAQELRELDMTPDNCAIGCRIFKMLEKLKIPEEEIAEFLKEIFQFSQQLDINTETLRDALIEFVKISQKVPFSQVPNYIQEKREEIKQLENKKKNLEEEIQVLEKEKLATVEKTSCSIKDANITLVDLDLFINTKNKLASSGIPVEDINKFTRFVQGIENYSNYDPFKVIEKFSDLKKLEIEIENNQKIKSDLELNIQKLKENESDYNDRLNLKYIKLKNLEELEETGLTTQDLKKLNRILIEIAIEHKTTNKEQLKVKFFELFEKLEDRLALDNENNAKMQLNLFLENQIKLNRQKLHCQVEVGPILKNLIERGITENEIFAMKGLIDILLYNSSTVRGNNIANTNTNTNIKYENFGNLSINNNNNNNNNNESNCGKEYDSIKWSLTLNLFLGLIFSIDLDKIQCDANRLRAFPFSISNYENSDSDDRKQEGVDDSIIQ